MTMAGPTIQVDSSVTEPRIEIVSNTYVLRLPATAAKVLFDSLPSFSPLQLASYPKGATPAFTYLHAEEELPSVLLGDFNGDSTLDVAMEGRSNQTSATVLVLSKSSINSAPKLVLLNAGKIPPADSVAYIGLLHPHQITDPNTMEVAVNLQTDGVQRVVPYQSSTVYYLQNGSLKQYVYSGD